MAAAPRHGNGPPEIGILMYPGVQLSAALGLIDLFFYANMLSQTRLGQSEPLLRISQLDADGKLSRRTDTAPDYGGAPLAIVLPPCLTAPGPGVFSDDLIDWLRNQHDAGVTLAAVCGGGFLLAETGLLQGRTATTHYSLTTLYSHRFPNVVLDADKLIIDHGDVVTAGGLMAWTDLGLRLVERVLGRTAMVETARFLLLDLPGREQRFYSIFTPKLAHGDAAILKVQHWLQKVGTRNVTAGIMAKRAGLEERTFLRRFHKATGFRPIEYCQQMRVGKARELLEESALPIGEVAWEVGYKDPGSFRKVFVRITGLTPGDHRKRFGAQEPGNASTIR
jgi:transcriptional regulator GlxA family with amidase domain